MILPLTFCFALYLLFEDNYSICVIFDGFIIASEHKLSVGFGKIVFDHMIIAVLESFPYILEGRLILIELIVNGGYKIVDKAILFISYQTMS